MKNILQSILDKIVPKDSKTQQFIFLVVIVCVILLVGWMIQSIYRYAYSSSMSSLESFDNEKGLMKQSDVREMDLHEEEEDDDEDHDEVDDKVDDKKEIRISGFYINMDKNKERNEMFKQMRNNSDLKKMDISRYSAVVGSKVNLSEHLTPDALYELNQFEITGYRTKHYQLTRGGVGCFLSHYNLAKQLLSDNSVDYYLIMEDDIVTEQNVASEIKKEIRTAPKGWDMLLFGYSRLVPMNKVDDDWVKVRAFWGMYGYVINKNGARKLVQEVDSKKIDGQIDSYLARMVQKGQFNLYAINQVLIKHVETGTDIQIPLARKEGVDPFDFGGYKV